MKTLKSKLLQKQTKTLFKFGRATSNKNPNETTSGDPTNTVITVLTTVSGIGQF